jgi:hypothetical protein
MYAPKKEEVYQGDILRDYHFMLPPLGKPYAFVESGKEAILAEDIMKAGLTPKQLIANTIITNAMIITATCDAQRREFVAVCPIFTLEKIKLELSTKWGDARIKTFIDDLSAQKFNYYLYLPAVNTAGIVLPESYIDLQVINSMPLDNIKHYERMFTLSDYGRHWLAYKLANLFSRPA